jgi:hypothetical protein
MMNKSQIASFKVVYGFRDGDCTNNGITSKRSSVTVAWGENADKNDSADFYLCDQTGEVVRNVKHLRSLVADGKYVKAAPTKKIKGMCGPMNGGNYVQASNGLSEMSSFPFPIPVHDRFESYELNDMLSR